MMHYTKNDTCCIEFRRDMKALTLPAHAISPGSLFYTVSGKIVLQA